MTSSLTFALDVYFHHATFTPHPPRILQEAPCIELATFYSTEEGFLENVDKFRKALDEAKPDGYYGFASGGVVEELRREGKNDNGQAVVLCVAWASKEAHLKFRDAELFKENIWLLREKQGGVVMVGFLASYIEVRVLT